VYTAFIALSTHPCRVTINTARFNAGETLAHTATITFTQLRVAAAHGLLAANADPVLEAVALRLSNNARTATAAVLANTWAAAYLTELAAETIGQRRAVALAILACTFIVAK
jgi:hypothetical protein